MIILAAFLTGVLVGMFLAGVLANHVWSTWPTNRMRLDHFERAFYIPLLALGALICASLVMIVVIEL